MAVGAKFDKATYKPGDTMRLTVTVAAGERNQDVPVNVHVDIPGVGSADAVAVVDKPPVPVSVVDAARVWTLASDDETTAVFTATA